jgi:hypothetical protein
MTHVVLIHGGKSTKAKLEAALPGATVTIVYRPGLSSAYDETNGIAKEFPTLRGFMKEHAPSWKPGEPLILLGFSAGGWALRYYLRDESAREDVTAAVFLDATYGLVGNACNLAPYQGVIAFAKLANAQPSRKRAVLTFSQAHPAPGACAKEIARAAGSGVGVLVVPYQNADHGAQQSVAGPEALRALRAWLGTSPRLAGSSGADDDGALLLVAAVLLALWE